MNITSRSSIIRRGELRRCLELLGPEYMELPYSIYVYKDKEEVISEKENNPNMSIEMYDFILRDTAYAPPGVCVQENKIIKLYPFNQKPSQSLKVDAIAFAFHEVRHAWQYNKDLYSGEIESIPSESILDYLNKPSEIDAYKFAEDQMNAHMMDIKRILQLPSNIGFNYKFDLERKRW